MSPMQFRVPDLNFKV